MREGEAVANETSVATWTHHLRHSGVFSGFFGSSSPSHPTSNGSTPLSSATGAFPASCCCFSRSTASGIRPSLDIVLAAGVGVAVIVVEDGTCSASSLLLLLLRSVMPKVKSSNTEMKTQCSVSRQQSLEPQLYTTFAASMRRSHRQQALADKHRECQARRATLRSCSVSNRDKSV